MGKKLVNGQHTAIFYSSSSSHDVQLPDPDITGTLFVDGDSVVFEYKGGTRTYEWNETRDRYEWEPPWTGGPYDQWFLEVHDQTGADGIDYGMSISDFDRTLGGVVVK